MEKRTAFFVSLVFVILTFIQIGVATQVPKRGVLDGANLDTKDIYYQWEKETGERFPSFVPEPVVITMVCPDGITEEDLREISRRHDRGVDHFVKNAARAGGETVVFSIANFPNFRCDSKTGDCSTDHYDDLGTTLLEWREQVAEDRLVHGILVGKDLKDLSIYLFPPVGYDEVVFGRLVTEFVEEREIAPFEWFSKSDIFAKDWNGRKILLAGGIIDRLVIDGAANKENSMRSALGIFAALSLLVFVLGSFRQALIAGSVMTISMVWARSNIVWANHLGFSFAEGPYTTIVLTNSIIQGSSFAIQMFSSFNRTRAKMPNTSREMVWLTAAPLRRKMISLTAIISAGSFLCQLHYTILPVREVGALSIGGLISLWLLGCYFLPAIHILVGGEKKEAPRHFAAFYRFVGKTLEGTSSLLLFPLSRNSTLQRSAAAFLFVITLGSAVYCWKSGKIIADTKEMEFLRGTTIEESNNYMEEPGRPGFVTMTLVVEPKDASINYHTPEFYKSVWSFAERLEKHPDIRRVGSFLHSVCHIMTQLEKRCMPEDEAVMAQIWMAYIESGTPEELRPIFYTEEAYRITISFPAKGSAFTGNLREWIRKESETFKTLRVIITGKMATYPSIDDGVKKGHPRNITTNIIPAFFVILLWVFYTQKRRAGSHDVVPWRFALVMIIPFVFANAAMTTFMALARVPLDIATTVFANLALNACVDFSVNLIQAYRRLLSKDGNPSLAVQEALKEEGTIILSDALVNSICFLPLVTSIFLPIQRLGIMLVVMIGLSAIGALLLMPQFLPWCIKQKNISTIRFAPRTKAASFWRSL